MTYINMRVQSSKVGYTNWKMGGLLNSFSIFKNSSLYLTLVLVVLSCVVLQAQAGPHHNHPHSSSGYSHGHGTGGSGHDGHGCHSSYKKHTQKTMAMGRESNKNLALFKNMLREEKNKKNGATFADLITKLPVPVGCIPPTIECDTDTPYRTANGTCNNLSEPFKGSSFTAFGRLTQAAYDDGFDEPRGGRESILPNPRTISTTIHPDLISPDLALTNMVPQVGQFLDHDLTLAPESGFDCCGHDKAEVDCWSISISDSDYFYGQPNVSQSCMAFTRSTPFCFGMGDGIREQMNVLTAFVDASQVYGSDDTRANQLRSFEDGCLITNKHEDFEDFLPTKYELDLQDNPDLEGTFVAGDNRVNEMPALTTMHTLLFREHNRLALAIAEADPDLTDENIYQAARRLVIAEWQNIIYGQYLPIILGPLTMTKYNLTIDPKTHSVYNGATDPTIVHAFATAAYRFGHSMINGLIRMMRNVDEEVKSYQIRDAFFNDSLIKFNNGEGYDLILTGLMHQNSQTFDRHVTEDLSNFLLRDPKDNFGSDLLARNIQRGRDHGLSPYHSYRKYCSLSPLTTNWSQVPEEFTAESWQNFASLYNSPKDIDLFPAGMAEIPLHNAVTGATFNCLKAIQFQRLKFGDRHFFTHGDQAGSFSSEQLEKITRVNLGDLICQNSRIKKTTLNVFRPQSWDNPLLDCDDTERRQFLNVSDFL